VAYKKTEEFDEYAARGGARKTKGKGTAAAAAAAAANKENAETIVEKKAVAPVSEINVPWWIHNNNLKTSIAIFLSFTYAMRTEVKGIAST
jgi:hypothetical protein